MMKRAASLILALALSACAGAPLTPKAPLVARSVPWSPSQLELGPIRAVAEAGSEVVVFGDGAAAIFVDGALVNVDRSVRRWASAAAIPAADGAGTWIVGIDGAGRVLRLRGRGPFEPVSDRYGLERAVVTGAQDTGGGGAAFALGSELALADGTLVTRCWTGPFAAFAAGGGRVAFAADVVREVDLASRAVRAFDVGPSNMGSARAPLLAMTGTGKLFVATPEAVYGEDDAGALRLRHRSPDRSVHGLAISGDRVWFAEGGEIGVIEANGVRETSGAGLPRQGALVGSPSGDVWVLAAGALRRFAAQSAAPGWNDLAPVFARACSGCHGPKGESGVDLSTKDAWGAHSQSIARRVLTEHTMPPPGHAISDGDRDRIRRWIQGALPR